MVYLLLYIRTYVWYNEGNYHKGQVLNMHEVDAKGILSAKNGINLYRGCQHGCIYCDSRSTCYQMNHAFEDIEVKRNSLEILEKELKSRRNKCMISTGAMTDPYLPLEQKLLYTRRSLELIEEYGFGARVLTKSDLILRDLDVITRIHQKTRFVLEMTLTTYDEDLCRIIEPNVAQTKQRFEVLQTFREAGIPTIVWLCPILPFINDTKEKLQGILDYCQKAKVAGIVNFGMGVTLRSGDREYFYKALDKSFPGLTQKYIRTYGEAYSLLSPNNQALMSYFRDFCRANWILSDPSDVMRFSAHFEEKNKPVQLSLFDS